MRFPPLVTYLAIHPDTGQTVKFLSPTPLAWLMFTEQGAGLRLHSAVAASQPGLDTAELVEQALRQEHPDALRVVAAAVIEGEMSAQKRPEALDREPRHPAFGRFLDALDNDQMTALLTEAQERVTLRREAQLLHAIRNELEHRATDGTPAAVVVFRAVRGHQIPTRYNPRAVVQFASGAHVGVDFTDTPVAGVLTALDALHHRQRPRVRLTVDLNAGSVHHGST